MSPTEIPALRTKCCKRLSLAHLQTLVPGSICIPISIPKTTMRTIIANITTSHMLHKYTTDYATWLIILN